MPPITELPAAARLLPVVFPLSIMLLDPFGSITEFFRVASFLPVEPDISAISPTLGSALEFLNSEKVGESRAVCPLTYRLVMPALRLTVEVESARPDV